MDQLFVFLVGDMKQAIFLSGVQKVELAVEVTPLPEAPRIVIGAINWRGYILPVLSMRRRLHFPERDVMASDRMVIVQSRRRRFALMVDEVMGVQQAAPDDFTQAGAISEGLDSLAGASRTQDGIVLIHDLDLFLNEADEKVLAGL